MPEEPLGLVSRERAPFQQDRLCIMNKLEKASSVRQIRLERHLPSYWRVTFDHSPLNIFGPDIAVETTLV